MEIFFRDCSGFYSPIGYMDAGCYGPVYPGIGANAASGDGGVLCKDMFTPNDIPMTTQPSEVKSVGKYQYESFNLIY